MASRPKGFGMTAELDRKRAAKYDPDLAKQAMQWIEAVLGEGLAMSSYQADDVQDVLKDGVILCRLIMNIDPSIKIKHNTSKMAFKMMENIGKFLDACDKMGVSKTDMFQTVDLYEGQNMPQVINGIHALGRKAQSIGFNGPVLGPSESTENKREFTDAQLREGQNVIGLQAGSNKGASQAGDHFGRPRQIADAYK